ncbi:TPA: hypothetical protein ACGX5L_003026, partial [Listeria monocytogenes]
ISVPLCFFVNIEAKIEVFLADISIFPIRYLNYIRQHVVFDTPKNTFKLCIFPKSGYFVTKHCPFKY